MAGLEDGRRLQMRQEIPPMKSEDDKDILLPMYVIPKKERVKPGTSTSERKVKLRKTSPERLAAFMDRP